MSVNILFWNVNKKDLRKLACAAAADNAADVLILIENSETASDTLASLQSIVSSDFLAPAATPGRFQLFTRHKSLDLREVDGADRFSLRSLQLNGIEILIGIVHLVDKMNFDEISQAVEVKGFADEVRRCENQRGHQRTILIGDFNLNPFDKAMNMAAGLNAMMTLKCIENGTRTLQSTEYPFFYNPMWGLFGDRTKGPPGTYFHRSSSRGIYGWNMLDQVLIRPAAVHLFEDVQILENAGTTSLQTNQNRPNFRIASDHLPILLKIK